MSVDTEELRRLANGAYELGEHSMNENADLLPETIAMLRSAAKELDELRALVTKQGEDIGALTERLALAEARLRAEHDPYVERDADKEMP